VEDRQPIVARRTVRAEHHLNSCFEQTGDVGDSGTELEVGARTVADRRARLGKTLYVGAIEVDAMRENNVLTDEAVIVEKIDVAEAAKGSYLVDLVAILGCVTLQQPSLFSRELGAAAQQTG
jgi:hypothetical protein